jgi:adenylate cyclase
MAKAPAPSPRQSHWAIHVDMPTRMRLFSGIVLFVYALTHFINHALGLISLDALEAGRLWFVAVWRSLPGSILLLGSLAVHITFALWKLFQRRTFNWARWEWMQLFLGLIIPLLLVPHLLDTRMMNTAFGVEDSYAYVLLRVWPDAAWSQTLLLLFVWIHGCLGLHYWLRLKAWYRRLLPWLLGAAVLIPACALLGFVNGGRTVAELSKHDFWLKAVKVSANWPGELAEAVKAALTRYLMLAFAALLLIVAAGRGVRAVFDKYRRTVTVRYPDGRRVTVPRGVTVLEASRRAGLPHAAVCGGRGRCSTCRVRIGKGGETLPPPIDDERRVLDRVGARLNERLACQIKPRNDIDVTPLLPASAGPEDTEGRPVYTFGEEQHVAVLVSDLRGRWLLAEDREAPDLVFLLNQYLRAMASCIEQVGGRVQRFDSGRLIALFGIGQGAATGSISAMAASCLMANALRHFNEGYASELGKPLAIGTGIHVGKAVIGEVGTYDQPTLTAIGDVTGIAARLQAATVSYRCQILISGDIAEWSGANLAGLPKHTIYTRAGQNPTEAYAVDDPLKLGEVLIKQAGRLGRKPARRKAAKPKKPPAASPETTIPEPPADAAPDPAPEPTPPTATGKAQAVPTSRVAS